MTVRNARDAMPARGLARRFWPLFAIQTFAVAALVYLALPSFVAIADNLGRAVSLPLRRAVEMTAALVVFHLAYWSRMRWASMPTMPGNILLNHLFLFMSRLSFIFGAAFFSLVSFRHLPALTGPTDLLAASARTTLLLAILFSLFCYALEFERLGKEAERKADVADQGSI